MANKNSCKQGFLNFFNLGSKEEGVKPVLRVRELDDLAQKTSRHTTLDPAAGRVTSTRLPAGSLAPSGHYLADLDNGLLGECIACRQEFEAARQPELINVVPKAEGGGGICVGCQRIFCPDHGAVDGDGRFWCEDCQYGERVKNVEKTLARAALGTLASIFREQGD